MVSLSGSLRLGVAWNHHLWSLILACLFKAASHVFPPKCKHTRSLTGRSSPLLPSTLLFLLLSAGFHSAVIWRHVIPAPGFTAAKLQLCRLKTIFTSFTILTSLIFLVPYDLPTCLHRKSTWLIFNTLKIKPSDFGIDLKIKMFKISFHGVLFAMAPVSNGQTQGGKWDGSSPEHTWSPEGRCACESRPYAQEMTIDMIPKHNTQDYSPACKMLWHNLLWSIQGTDVSFSELVSLMSWNQDLCKHRKGNPSGFM